MSNNLVTNCLRKNTISKELKYMHNSKMCSFNGDSTFVKSEWQSSLHYTNFIMYQHSANFESLNYTHS